MAVDTKTKILDAAEVLFSEQGYMQTSMREITAKAEVNLASVNYHFGSKKNLIQAVLKRYFDVLMPRIDNAISDLTVEVGTVGIEKFLVALIKPMLALNNVSPQGTEKFVQLLGRGYNETQGHLRRFIMQDYGTTISALSSQLRCRLPHLSEQELFWRLHFAIGSFVFSMASSKALTEIAHSDFNQQANVADVIGHLVPFVAHGLAGKVASNSLNTY